MRRSPTSRRYRVLYRDAEGDQRVYSDLRVADPRGAAFAALQPGQPGGRGAAPGDRRRAWRSASTRASWPFARCCLGAEIALLGAVLGLALGLLVRAPLRTALEDLLPLPVIAHPVRAGRVRARRAARLPAATRGNRSTGVARRARAPDRGDPGGLPSAKSGGLAPLLRRLRLPGGSLGQMPARNVLRAPRRTLMTVFGIAAVIAVLVSMLGMIDSFLATVDRSEAETRRCHALTLGGDAGPLPRAGLDRAPPARRAIPAVAAAEPRIAVPALGERGRRELRRRRCS